MSAEASARTTTNNITVTFSEPVQPTSGVAKVDGVTSAVAPGSNPNEITITTGANLSAGSSYDVELLNFRDYAGNYLTPNPVKTTVTVKADVVAPTVTDVKVVRDNLIEVTFDKSMKASTLDNTTVRLLDGNFTNIATTNITNIQAKANTNNRVFEISLDNTPEIPFNDGVFKATLVFTDSITDSLGNKLNTTNRNVTITEDTTEPSVTSVSFKKANSTGATYGGVSLANGAIVVKFNESIAKVATTVGDLKLIDNNGKDVTSTYITNTEMAAALVNTDDNTELVIPLATTVTEASEITSFTLRLPSAVAEDLSLGENESKSAVETFAVEAGTDTAGDTTKPQVTGVAKAAGSNNIEVTVVEANLDNSSVLNLNNYRLDGKPLPEGTYVTINSTGAPTHVITLNLPAGSISESRDYAVNVSGIKDQAGNVADLFTNNTVALVDDVAPELDSVVLNKNGSLTLSYTEELASTIAAADLAITLNGKVVDSGSITVNAGAGAEAGNDIVTVQVSVDAGGDTTYEDGNEVLYIDVDGVAGYNATDDILISTGSYAAALDGTDFDLNDATTLKVGTIASPSTKDVAGNDLKGNASFTIKK